MNTTLLISGPSSGIGRASAGLYAAEGCNPVATLREPSAGRATNSEEVAR